ncbi:hypothetical protein [Paenibacillus dendritiformis]|uniref:hypothetical protein n=1 Tax=Paenibacillus dendritiformis TaxID=130049 RepID=UPI00387E0719
MKIKVTIMGTDWGYYTIEDYTDYYEDVKHDRGEDGANIYFACGEFTDQWVNENKDDHFLFGWCEGLSQSDYVPYAWCNETRECNYKVEWIKE